MNRKGSALLIVLGMMAFMIVSAVAFSAYMRYARLPSSYLRRTSASRQLAKAALARAIDEVDRSIANDPHPNVGSSSANVWKGRVLTSSESLLSPSDTVPVLTLEGLAYIPPSLVNEVRHFSRRSPAARWHQFGFDSGRFAFCAVDVSDYFDVNRMLAKRARTSAPNGRLSLSHLFETGVEHSGPGTGAKAWDDDFMKKFRNVKEPSLKIDYGSSETPLVSLADYNLALYAHKKSGGIGGIKSPFCNYVMTPEGDGFYDAGGEDELDMFARQTFVTDSYFPGGREQDAEGDGVEQNYEDVYDLNDGNFQPLARILRGGSSGPRALNTTTLGDLMTLSDNASVRLSESVPVYGLAALYDYLDKDSLPISLAIPTVERAPMICGIKPNLDGLNFPVKLDPAKPPVTDAQGNPLPAGKGPDRDVYSKYDYYIDTAFAASLGGFSVDTLAAYPFAHKDGVTDTSFSVDGRAAFFLTRESNPMKMRIDMNSIPLPLQGNPNTVFTSIGLFPDRGLLLLPLQPTPLSFTVGGQMTEEKALANKQLKQAAMLAGSELKKAPLMSITYKWTQKWVDTGNGTGHWDPEDRPPNAEIDKAHCGIPPLLPNGSPDPDFTDDTKFLGVVKDGKVSAKLNVAVTLRVRNSAQKTVDLVPGHMKDDNTLNGINNFTGLGPRAATFAGNYPVMRFLCGGVTLKYSATGMDDVMSAPQSMTPTPLAVRVDDPRFNYAPENWYSAETVDALDWLDTNMSRERDGDIFMATSDQGYMQSIYELAFIPRFSDFNNRGETFKGGMLTEDDNRPAFGTKGEAVNRHMMWDTYRPFRTGAGNADDFEGLGFTSAGSGMKVNPYSDSTNVLMAAFANTPIDWCLAATNNPATRGVQDDAAAFNRTYAWNAYNEDAKILWKDLTAIAGRLRTEMRDQRNNGWLNAWRNLGWNYNPNEPEKFCGIELDTSGSDLWGVDRRFLYGYWRDCFAAKQQLFLIFVRAEPLMMGGEGINQSPPQLGVRAVALVWRDPTKTLSSDGEGSAGYPHRTRVLFYRQLD